RRGVSWRVCLRARRSQSRVDWPWLKCRRGCGASASPGIDSLAGNVTPSGLARKVADQLGPGVNIELPVDARKVTLDSLRTQEERGADLPVCLSFCDLERDLELLRGQLLEAADVPTAAKGLAARTQFGVSS